MTKVLFLFSVPAFGVSGPGLGFSRPTPGFSKPSVEKFTPSAVNPARRVATTGPGPVNSKPNAVKRIDTSLMYKG